MTTSPSVVRAAFDATIDELLEVHLLAAERTPAWRRQRQRSKLAMAVAGAVVATALFLPSARPFTTSSIVVAMALAAAGAALAWWFASAILDRFLRRNLRRMIRQMYGGAESVPFVIELRREGAWVQCHDTEMQCEWSELSSIDEADDRIELWFNAGVVVVRSRAFTSSAERRRFIDSARALAGSGDSHRTGDSPRL